MTTKLFVNVGKNGLIKNKEKYSFEQDFYFQDSPEKVLRRIIVDYPVQKFNNLEIYQENCLSLVPSKNKGHLNKLFIGGMIISDSLSPQKLNSLENFDKHPDFKLIRRKSSPNMQEIMYSLISNYLIEEKMVNSGSETLGINNRNISHTPSKWQGQFYLNQRQNNFNIEKENSLEDIIKYGKAVFGKNFGMDQIKEMGNRLLEQYPIEKRPTKTYFANLRPNGGMFHKYKK